MFKATEVKPLTALYQGYVHPTEIAMTTDKGVYHLTLHKTY